MSTGALLIQLGTPDAPTPRALRPYLREFLWDPRIIEEPRFKWWFILNLFILPVRPRQSAAKYARIWDPQRGSPLLYNTEDQVRALQAALPSMPVRFGMQIGKPSLADAVRDLIDAGIDRLIILPMYPQYSATTTASAMDALFKVLMKERRIPALRVVPPYYEHPAYVNAVAQIIRGELAKLDAPPDHYVLSFHGIPIIYAQRGDPYATHVKRTTAHLVELMEWPRDQWTQSFQSLFGRKKWLRPYTDEVLKSLARQGKKRIFIAMPGFTADCLETVDEIGNDSSEFFRHAGGEKLFRCPCLNDHPAWIEAMRTLILENGQGWL